MTTSLNNQPIDFEALKYATSTCANERDDILLGNALAKQNLVLQVTEDAEIISLVQYHAQGSDESVYDIEDSDYDDPNGENYSQLDAYIAFINAVQNLSDSNPDFLQEIGSNNWELVDKEEPIEESENLVDAGEEELEYYDELLTDLVGQTILSNGPACLKLFAAKYSTQCEYEEESESVVFSSVSHEFTIHTVASEMTNDCLFYVSVFNINDDKDEDFSIISNNFETIEEALDHVKRLLIKEQGNASLSISNDV